MKAIFLVLVLILGLISSQETAADLKDHVSSQCSNKEVKVNPKLTLGYFTPWGKNGQEIALNMITKLDIITPCWFEIKPEYLNGKFNSMIDGSNYVNTQFIKDVKTKNPKALLLPRFHCQNFNLQTFTEFLEVENRSHFFRVLMRRLKYNKYHGIVLDCNTFWMIESLYSKTADFLRELYENLRKEKMTLVTTLYPYAESFQNILSRKRFEYLAKHTDYFNIMTYDYLQYSHTKESKNTIQQIAPITWLDKTLDYYVDPKAANRVDLLAKIILGLPFHGLLLEMGTSEPKGQELDPEMFSTIANSIRDSDLQWDDKEKEHHIQFSTEGKKMMALYPTRKFFKERIKFAIENGLAGVSIWELTKGQESFMDEF